MKRIKSWWTRFTSPTPKKWKTARNFFGGIAAGLTGGLVAINTVNLALPDSMKTVITVSLFVFAGIAAYCQSHETNTKGNENT